MVTCDAGEGGGGSDEDEELELNVMSEELLEDEELLDWQSESLLAAWLSLSLLQTL